MKQTTTPRWKRHNGQLGHYVSSCGHFDIIGSKRPCSPSYKFWTLFRDGKQIATFDYLNEAKRAVASWKGE